MVEREAKEWPRTHRLLVHASMSTESRDHHYSGSRVYQQRSSVSPRSHLFPSSGDRVKQDRAGYTGRLIERDFSQREQGVGGERFYSRRYVYLASARDDCSCFRTRFKIFETNMEFVQKALIRIGRHHNVTYGKWITDEGIWSEFEPQAEGENQREKKQAEREIIVDKYGQ